MFSEESTEVLGVHELQPQDAAVRVYIEVHSLLQLHGPIHLSRHNLAEVYVEGVHFSVQLESHSELSLERTSAA